MPFPQARKPLLQKAVASELVSKDQDQFTSCPATNVNLDLLCSGVWTNSPSTQAEMKHFLQGKLSP